MRRLQALCLFACVIAAPAWGGCGEGGAASGATVSVYVAGPLCGEAHREVEGGGGGAGDLEVRVVCLAAVARGGRSDLATAGANARRATEDSTAVAFVEVPGGAAKFTQSIVENADIAWVETRSAAPALRRILEALEGAGSSPRKAVLDEVG